VQRFLEGALQIPISLGSTQNAWEETSAAVAAPYAELHEALRREAVVNADETGHRTNGDKRWLWTFVARTFVVYRIAASRGSDVLQMVLGASFAGILGSDRLPTYFTYVVGQRQLCWAHMTRNLLSALDLARTPAAQRFCREALVLERRLFRLWHRFRGDPAVRGAPLTRAELITKVWPIEKRLFALGERHLQAANGDVPIWRARSSCTISTSSRLCTKRGWSPPTIRLSEPCARQFNGAKSCLARGATPVNVPLNGC
jgi:transposase